MRPHSNTLATVHNILAASFEKHFHVLPWIMRIILQRHTLGSSKIIVVKNKACSRLSFFLLFFFFPFFSISFILFVSSHALPLLSQSIYTRSEGKMNEWIIEEESWNYSPCLELVSFFISTSLLFPGDSGCFSDI